MERTKSEGRAVLHTRRIDDLAYISSRRGLRLVALLTLLFPISALAEDLSIARSGSAESLAFARYIGSIQDPNPFTGSVPVAMAIEASLPGLFKQSRLLAIRQLGESERSEYSVLQTEGDATVTQEVIARYFELQQQLEDLHQASLAITPANYRFHYVGEVGNGDTPAYVFRIVPKKKRDGLIQGQLWIDSVTGVAVLQSGHFVRTHSASIRRIEIVADTKLINGYPYARVTHMTIETPRAGRGELTIIERPLVAVEENEPSPSIGGQQAVNFQPGPTGLTR
jgi:hypothetical protein